MIEYLKTEGTCKCGLDCPFFIHKVFNFDARIPSKLIPVNSRQEPSQSGCKHCTVDYLDAQQPSEIAVKQANDVKLPPFSTLAQKRGDYYIIIHFAEFYQQTNQQASTECFDSMIIPLFQYQSYFNSLSFRHHQQSLSIILRAFKKKFDFSGKNS